MANILRKTLLRTNLEPQRNLTRAINTSLCHYSNEAEGTAVFNNGRSMKFSSGKYAKMANGAAVVESGDTAVMVTAVRKDLGSYNESFLPLNVEFKMKSAAMGRIPTNHLRRELGQSEREILTARLTDRSVRPLFPQNYFSEVQIMSNLLSADGINDPEVLCVNAASMALTLSDIPWNGPVGAVRVGLINDEIIINPTRQELQKSALNLVVTGMAPSKVVMIEGSCDDLNLNTVMHCIKAGIGESKKILSVIQAMAEKYGKKKHEYDQNILKEEFVQHIELHYTNGLKEILKDFSHTKESRDKAIAAFRETVAQNMMNKGLQNKDDILRAFNSFFKSTFRNLIFETDIRCDGRDLNDVRDISCEVNLYKPLHGSAVFQRGHTQVLCTVALDSPQSAFKTDSYTILTSGIKEKSFFLTYEFPGYATNEVSQRKGISRREVGHGALAEKGLRPVVPKDFPFCIRLTSEVLESNGSSSMATVCGGTLALLDAGVPLSAMAGGVAMGLVTRCDTNGEIEDYRLLTDLLGIEDYVGDMDFKIAGTKTGITALQADFKIPGVTLDLLGKALAKGHAAKTKIIKTMQKTICEPSVKEGQTPILETFEVPIHKRNKLLGPAWVNVKKLFLETGVQIWQVEDSKFAAFAPNEAAMQEAHEIVQKLMEASSEPEFEFGAIYVVKILEMKESGVMVSLHPQLHPVFINNSHLDVRKAAHPSALGLEVGQKISVKYFGRDPGSGQIRLSRKALQEFSGRVLDFEEPSSSPVITRERVDALGEAIDEDEDSTKKNLH